MIEHENVSRETIYQQYISELIKWNAKINLIAKKTETSILERHIKDSEQLSEVIGDKKSKIFDLGSGAGFPGLVLSINGFENVFLVEVNKKKADFLHSMVKNLKLTAQILNCRIESLGAVENIDFITARAFASIRKVIEYSWYLLNNRTRIVLLKGETWREELDDAEKFYSFSSRSIASQSQAGSRILEIWDICKKIK